MSEENIMTDTQENNKPKMVQVSAEALFSILDALNGPGHYIRELQATRSPLLNNPIDRLIKEYNAWAESDNRAESAPDRVVKQQSLTDLEICEMAVKHGFGIIHPGENPPTNIMKRTVALVREAIAVSVPADQPNHSPS